MLQPILGICFFGPFPLSEIIIIAFLKYQKWLMVLIISLPMLATSLIISHSNFAKIQYLNVELIVPILPHCWCLTLSTWKQITKFVSWPRKRYAALSISFGTHILILSTIPETTLLIASDASDDTWNKKLVFRKKTFSNNYMLNYLSYLVGSIAKIL